MTPAQLAEAQRLTREWDAAHPREPAADKGYHRSGLTGPNPLYAFVAETAGGPGHALGEIVYKVHRYAARRDPEDPVKVAAWAYLVWRFDQPDAGVLAASSVPEGGEG